MDSKHWIWASRVLYDIFAYVRPASACGHAQLTPFSPLSDDHMNLTNPVSTCARQRNTATIRASFAHGLLSHARTTSCLPVHMIWTGCCKRSWLSQVSELSMCPLSCLITSLVADLRVFSDVVTCTALSIHIQPDTTHVTSTCADLGELRKPPVTPLTCADFPRSGVYKPPFPPNPAFSSIHQHT
jgi:hypothetical protein